MSLRKKEIIIKRRSKVKLYQFFVKNVEFKNNCTKMNLNDF